MFVASFGAAVPGSSDTRLMPPLAVTCAWLPMTAPPASGVLSRTRKVTTTSLSAPPAPLRVPMVTESGFPSTVTSAGSSELRLPGTSVVFAGIASVRTTPVASSLPELVTVTA